MYVCECGLCVWMRLHVLNVMQRRLHLLLQQFVLFALVDNVVCVFVCSLVSVGQTHTRWIGGLAVEVRNLVGKTRRKS